MTETIAAAVLIEREAQRLAGLTYRLGGDGTDGTIDCWHTARRLVAAVGVTLPADAARAVELPTLPVEPGAAVRAGDLIVSGCGRHVAVAIGPVWAYHAGAHGDDRPAVIRSRIDAVRRLWPRSRIVRLLMVPGCETTTDRVIKQPTLLHRKRDDTDR